MQRRTPPRLFIVLALAAVGCETPREVELAGPPAAERAEQPARAVTPGQRAVEELRVRRPHASELDGALRAALPADARASLDAASVPVLLPARSSLIDGAKLVVKPAFTAAALRGRGDDEGLTVSISGTKIVHRHAGIEAVSPRDRVRGGKPAWVLMNEQVWSVTWEEHGVSYVVDLECARPSEDARCASPDAVLAIVEELRLAGGAGLLVGGAQ